MTMHEDTPYMRHVRIMTVAENMAIDLAPIDEEDTFTVSATALLAMLVTEYVVKGDLEIAADATLIELLVELRRKLGIVDDMTTTMEGMANGDIRR